MISDAEFQRFQRQICLPEMTEQGQKTLFEAKLLIIGCGGLGSAAAQYLAAAGVKNLVIADYDDIELSNLPRQLTYRDTDIGKLKVDVLADYLQQLAPDCRVRRIARKMDLSLLSLEVGLSDMVLDCTDNQATRKQINQACWQAKKNLIAASAIGWEGQLWSFDFSRLSQGCYQCLLPKNDDESAQLTCQSKGIVGAIVGTLGCLQALLSIQKILSLSTLASHQLLHFDGLSFNWQQWAMPIDPHCMVCSRKE